MEEKCLRSRRDVEYLNRNMVRDMQLGTIVDIVPKCYSHYLDHHQVGYEISCMLVRCWASLHLVRNQSCINCFE